MALKWGIASAGLISHDFVCSLRALDQSKHEVTAVAARGLKSAQDFAKRHNIPTALEGHEALATRKDVDIVYIGMINTEHLRMAKIYMDHGKHILCEKPLTVNAADSKEMVEYAKKKKVFLMEAVWPRFFPAYIELAKLLKSGIIGEVIHTNINFGFPLEKIERVSKKELGGSTILDIGIYTLQFTQFVFRGFKPKRFIGLGSVNEGGVDKFASGIIQYTDEKIASVTVSALALMANEAIIVGTKGIIKVPSFWCPNELITPEGSKTFPFPESKDTYNYKNSVGLGYQADECYRCIKAGLLESPGMPHSETVELAELMTNWIKMVENK